MSIVVVVGAADITFQGGESRPLFHQRSV